MEDPQGLGSALPIDTIPEEDFEEISALPPFANAENRALDAAVRGLEKALDKADAAFEENQDRISIMDEHLRNVQQELKYTQSRVEAKMKEIETEKHLQALAERENGRLRKDVTKLAQEKQEMADKVAGLQTQIFRANEKLDGFKLLMNWNQEELEQWALAERQKEEDNAALEKYRHADAAKVKELQLSLEKMSRVVVAKREEVEAEVLDTQAAQIQLDKAAEDFRKLHQERQDLIRQWDEALENMRHRDTAIAVASEQFAMHKAELREKKAALDAQARFLESEGLNNREVDARIAFYDREIGKQRDVYLREQQRLEALGNEVEAVRATLAKTATELAQKTATNEGARTTLDDKRARLDAARKKYAVLRRRLEGEFAALDGLGAKVEELEAIRRGDEARLKAVLKETEDLKKEQFKRGQKLFELRTRERELVSEISGGQGQNKNLAARIASLDEQVVRQQELLYGVEFQLQQMERKVARAQGVRSEEESRALNARIAKLTSTLEEVNVEHSMLLEQVKHSEEDLLKARRVNAGLRAERGKLEETLAALRLENEMVGRQAKAAVGEKEKAMVDHDVMKLEVKRLRDILALHADEVFSLENRRFQLKMSMEERRQEVEVHRDGLRAELRAARDDVHRLTLELKERALRVEKLQAKYEILAAKTRGAGELDENGEPRSQAYYVIKAAQEREELQREGDELDASIRKAEKEVAALEATLGQLMQANGAYGNTFKKVDTRTSFAERAALRERLDKAYDRLKFKRQEEAVTAAECGQINGRLANLSAEQQGLANLVDDLGRRKTEAERQVDEQNEKLGRARRAARRAAAALGLPQDEGEAAGTVQAKEATLAEMREVAKAMLGELAALAAAYPEVGIDALAQSVGGLRLPPVTPHGAPPGTPGSVSSAGGSRYGSRPGSARSGMSAGGASMRSAAGARAGSQVGGSRPGSRGPAVRQMQLGVA